MKESMYAFDGSFDTQSVNSDTADFTPAETYENNEVFEAEEAYCDTETFSDFEDTVTSGDVSISEDTVEIYYVQETPSDNVQIFEENDSLIDNLDNADEEDISEELSFDESEDFAEEDADFSDEYAIAEGTDNLSELPQWLGDINPNYDPYDVDSPYCNNCGSCTYAVWRRLQGDTEICATAQNIGYNSEMTALTGMEQVPMSPYEIEQRLLSQGNGAHAIIGIDRSEGPGHWFNAACIDGKVVAIDGQTGEIHDWPPDYGDVVNWEMSIPKEELYE